jgi:hypothetical protein
MTIDHLIPYVEMLPKLFWWCDEYSTRDIIKHFSIEYAMVARINLTLQIEFEDASILYLHSTGKYDTIRMFIMGLEISVICSIDDIRKVEVFNG